MYTVYCVQHDTEEKRYLLHDPRSRNHHILSPKLSMKLSKSGTFTFTVPSTNNNADKITENHCTIMVYQDEKFLWAGRPLLMDTDFYNNKTYTCEGVLGLLLDVIIPPFSVIKVTPSGIIQFIVSEYATTINGTSLPTLKNVNANIPIYDSYAKHYWRTFTAPKNSDFDFITSYDADGYVTGVTENTITRYSEKPISAAEVLQTELIEHFGGHIDVTESENTIAKWQILYIDSTKNIASQKICFGENLTGLSKSVDMTEFYTALMPVDRDGNTLLSPSGENMLLRRRADGTVEKMAVKPNGYQFICNVELVRKYGLIIQTYEVDSDSETIDHTEAFGRTAAVVVDLQPPTETIAVNAVDLHLTDSEIESFRVGQSVYVESGPHRIGSVMVLSELTIPLDNPMGCKITLNGTLKTLTKMNAR